MYVICEIVVPQFVSFGHIRWNIWKHWLGFGVVLNRIKGSIVAATESYSVQTHLCPEYHNDNLCQYSSKSYVLYGNTSVPYRFLYDNGKCILDVSLYANK